MKLLGLAATLAVVTAVALSPGASGHSPTGSSGNESLATAMHISDPLKSWVIYAELHEGGEACYYKFDLVMGQRIFLQLLKPTAVEFTGFMPGMVLMGPGIVNVSVVPGFVEKVQGDGAMVVNGTMPPQAAYEPFSPSSFYELARISMDAPETGTYHVAVFEPDRGGSFGLAVGERESFTISEWLLTPFSLLSVYQWEGQSIFVVLMPLATTLVVGLTVLLRRHMGGRKLDAPGWLAAISGLFMMGGGFTVLYQAAYALTSAPVDPTLAVTAVFGIVPLLLGIGVLRIALSKTGNWDGRGRAYLLVLGLVALFMWSGYLVGPVLAFIASVMPSILQMSARRGTAANEKQ